MRKYEDLYRMGYARTARTVEPDDFIVDLVSPLNEKGIKTILDVGCGAGRNAVFLAKEGFYLVGLDISATALSLASKRSHSEKIRNCLFVVGTFLNLPFQDGCFSSAFSSYGIENVSLPKIKEALSEMKRVVRKGGLLLVTLHSRKHWRFGLGKETSPHTFLTVDTIQGKRFEFVTHFFGKEEAERMLNNLDLKILSIKEVLKITDKKRAHWTILSEK